MQLVVPTRMPLVENRFPLKSVMSKKSIEVRYCVGELNGGMTFIEFCEKVL